MCSLNQSDQHFAYFFGKTLSDQTLFFDAEFQIHCNYQLCFDFIERASGVTKKKFVLAFC